MKYTDEEIINKFSKVDFDKSGLKQQAIYNRVTQACAQRRKIMWKKYSPLIATAVVLVVAVPVFLVNFGGEPGSCDGTRLPFGFGEIFEKPKCKELRPSTLIVRNQEETVAQAPDAKQVVAQPTAVPAVQPVQEAPVPITLDSAAAPSMSSRQAVKSFAASRATFGPMRTRGAALNGSAAFAGGGLDLIGGYGYPVQLSQDSQGYNENGFKKATLEPLSTFSADVDTASFNMLKEQINRGWKIDKDGVRTEALINNFAYTYPAPQGNDPISITVEYANAPWNEQNRLVKIGVKAKELDRNALPQSNLVFLIDVSGSMRGGNRLLLVKKAFKMLLNQLDENDIVSIVTYASGVDVKLNGVKVKNKQKIVDAMDALRAGGATSGEEGLKRAYEVAKQNFLRKGNNRIIIASDGDFNVGNSTTSALEKQVSQAKESGVFISALGFGMGNYRDHMMETIADKGNGNYAYINDLKAAQKALVREFGGTMFTVAKDVKFQVEFNPAVVEEYRLIGYEKRLLNNEDFNDDTKDAGEIGSGHTVTVFYEIRPKGGAEKMDIDPLKYTRAENTNTEEVLTVKMRYKDPQGDTSKLISKVLKKQDLKPFAQMSDDFRFASAAAAFGQLMRDGQFLNGFTAKQIADIASAAKGADENGDRAEFVQMIRTYADTPQDKEEAKPQPVPFFRDDHPRHFR